MLYHFQSYQQLWGARRDKSHSQHRPGSILFSPLALIPSASWHLSKFCPLHPSFVCLFLHLSSADRMEKWDFSCTGGLLGQENFIPRRAEWPPPCDRAQWPAGLAWGDSSCCSPSSPPQKLFPDLTFVPCCLPLPAGLVQEVFEVSQYLNFPRIAGSISWGFERLLHHH